MDVEHLSGCLLKPDSNTNLMCQRTVIPTLNGSISTDIKTRREIYLVVGVFAASTVRPGLMQAWDDVPKLFLGPENMALQGTTYIGLDHFHSYTAATR